MAQSNHEALGINSFESCIDTSALQEEGQVHPDFLASPWYKDIVHVLLNLQAPPEMSKTQARSVKLKATKFCIINKLLYWKDPNGILLNCLLEEEAKKKIKEFHGEDCGGHFYWKTTSHKILRADFYWPTLFADTYKQVSTCHHCQLFEGKRKLRPLPLKPISVDAPFQRWGLDFIGEINPASSGQHRWILTVTDYFTKWVEAVPTRQAIDVVIIEFLLSNIMSRFGCPRKIVTDNAKAFTSSKLVNFSSDYNIIFSHSTAY